MNKKFLFLLLFCFYTHLSFCKGILNKFNKNDQQDEQMVITSNFVDNEGFSVDSVKISVSGLKCFFKHKFNHPKYSKDYLPNNFSDLNKFIRFGRQTKQSCQYINLIIKIFNQKLKSIEFVSERELINFISILSESLEYYFSDCAQKSQLSGKNSEIYHMLYSEFATRYSYFTTEPEEFLSTLADKIELKFTILRFLECATSKFLWSPDDQKNSWELFKQLCNNIYNLRNKKIFLDLDNINDLINSAIARFELLIDISGSEIPSSVYHEALVDVESGSLPWLEIEEYDEAITSKKDNLITILKQGSVKSVALEQHGIISDLIV